MKYEHIIWDWNGTLFDDVTLCIDILNELLSKENLPATTLENYQRVFDFPVKNYYAKLGFDYSKKSYETLAEKFIAEYESRKSNCGLQKEARDIFAFLDKNGFSQSVLSAYMQSSLEKIIAHFEIDSNFIKISGMSDYYANGKIERGKKHVNELNIPKEKILLVGDTTHDFEVAEKIGIKSILFMSGHQNEKRLRKTGAQVISRLTDLKKILI